MEKWLKKWDPKEWRKIGGSRERERESGGFHEGKRNEIKWGVIFTEWLVVSEKW